MAASHTDSHPARTELASISLDDLIVAIRAGGVDARLAASGTTEQAAVRGMTVDSREVQSGNLFVCKGAAFRPAFLASAIERGACAYLCPNWWPPERRISSRPTFAGRWPSLHPSSTSIPSKRSTS